MKHKHAELMLQYAQDAMETDQPWERWEYRYCIDHEKWWPCDCQPYFKEFAQYRRKQRTIRIGEYDVPEPCREPLPNGTVYYSPDLKDPESPDRDVWVDGMLDRDALKYGQVHRTREAAIVHGKALASLTQPKP